MPEFFSIIGILTGFITFILVSGRRKIKDERIKDLLEDTPDISVYGVKRKYPRVQSTEILKKDMNN
jgi:hypothetical protein